MNTCWILTESSINDEDSQAEVFISAFKNKPTKKQLLDLDLYDHEADLLLDTGDTRIIGDYFCYILKEWELI